MSRRRKLFYLGLAAILVIAGVGFVLYGQGIIPRRSTDTPGGGPAKVDVVAIGRQHQADKVKDLFPTPPQDKYASCVTKDGRVDKQPIALDWKVQTWYKYCFAQLPGVTGMYVAMPVGSLSSGAEVRPEDGYAVTASKKPVFYVGFEQRPDGEGVMLYDPEHKLGLWKPPGISAADVLPEDLQVVTARSAATLADDQYASRYTAVQEALAAFEAYAITGD